MTCANPACGSEALYLRTGGIYTVGCLGGFLEPGHRHNIARRVTWLCDTCNGEFAVETWGPSGQQVRPSGSSRTAHFRVAARGDSAEGWN
jgi:hypothetical protein